MLPEHTGHGADALSEITRQSAEHHTEDEQQAQVVAAVDANLADVRVTVAGDRPRIAG